MNNLIDGIKENYKWVAAILAGIGVVLSFISQLIYYLYTNLYALYYGISRIFVENRTNNYLYEFALSILLVLCFYSLCYCYKQLYNTLFLKEKNGQTIINLFVILAANALILISQNIKYTLFSFAINLIIGICIEIIATVIVVKIFKYSDKKGESLKNKKEIKDWLLNVVKISPFYIVLMLILILTFYSFGLKNSKEYRLINDNMAIVCTNDNYYIVLDCEISDDNKLIIYKGTQTKIDNLDVSTELHKFDSVEVKDKK